MTDIKAIFDSDPRIASVREYHDGWVPNAYKWPAPGKATEHYREGDSVELSYDRKRSKARGPSWVAKSAAGGRLASG